MRIGKPSKRSLPCETSWDACLVIGDIVDYGVNPAPCVDWVRDHATAWVRGNHDHAVAQRVPAKGGTGFRALAAATRPAALGSAKRCPNGLSGPHARHPLH